jgi:hypothetical protein
MAIIFEKQLSNADILLTYNNNNLVFKSNSALTLSKATVSFQGLNFTLFPDPANKFYFNFKHSVSTLLNQNNFADNTVFTSNILNNYTTEIYRGFAVTFTIFFTNNTSETATVSYNFLSAYVNAKDYKQLYPEYHFKVNGKTFLKPTTYLKYWKGYPMDFTFYNGLLNNITIIVNGDTNVYTNTNRINRILLDNGNENFGIAESFGLSEDYNTISINAVQLQLEKVSNACDGHYIKFLNSFGGWNYWLFNKGNDTLTTKDLGTINNDYEDIVDTISPMLSIGKTSENNLTIVQEGITQNELLILRDLLDSPKVYLYTGFQNEAATLNDWLEIGIKSGSFRVANSREKMTTLNLNIDLPMNYTKTL